MKILITEEFKALILEEDDKYNKEWKNTNIRDILRNHRFDYFISDEIISQENILKSNLFKETWAFTHVGKVLKTKFIRGINREVPIDIKKI